MDFSLFLLGVLFISLMVSATASKRTTNNGVEDKGFVFSYHKLSPRRKLIRSLWLIPISAIVYFAVYQSGLFSSNELILLGIVLLAVAIRQLTNEYGKWKRSEKKE